MSLKKRLRDNHNEVDAGPLNDVLFILLMFFSSLPFRKEI